MQNREDLDLHVERRRQGKNRRRTGRMIAALAAIVIAGLLLLAQRGRVGPKAPDAKETPQTEAPADEAGVFADRSEKDVVSLKVENGGSSFSMIQGPEKGYVLDDAPDFVLDQGVARALFSFFQNPKAKLVMESCEDAAEFGLDAPAIKVDVGLDDGEIEQWQVGTKALTEDQYYASFTDQDGIYVVEGRIVRLLNLSREDLYALPTGPTIPDAVDVQRALAERPGAETIEIDYVDGDPIFDSPLRLVQPIEYDLEGERALEILDKMVAVLPAGYVGEAGDLPDCGFDRGTHVLVEDLHGNRMEYKIGDYMDDHRVYLQWGDSDAVFYTGAEAVAFTQYLRMDYIVSQFSNLIALSKVDSVSISSNDASYGIVVEREGDSERYYVNGSQVEEKPFKKLYQKIIGVMNSSICGDAGGVGEPALSVEYRLRDSGEVFLVEYLEYDDLYYALRRNGAVSFLVKQSSVRDLLAACAEYR